MFRYPKNLQIIFDIILACTHNCSVVLVRLFHMHMYLLERQLIVCLFQMGKHTYMAQIVKPSFRNRQIVFKTVEMQPNVTTFVFTVHCSYANIGSSSSLGFIIMIINRACVIFIQVRFFPHKPPILHQTPPLSNVYCVCALCIEI